MKILFVSDSFPAPPRNGTELPLARIMEHLSLKHTVSFARIVVDCADSAGAAENARLNASPIGFKRTCAIRARKPAFLKLIADEVLLRQPTYLAWDYHHGDLKDALAAESFDVIWVAPVGFGSFCQAYFKSFPERKQTKIVIGINDAIYYSYFEQGYAMLRGREKASASSVLRPLRALLLMWHERNYLARFDGCHVQTPNEKKRLGLALWGKSKPRVVVAQNGKSEALLDLAYTGAGRHNVLLMNHMTLGRERQGLWFIDKVWPLVLRENPGAVLHIFGSPPEGEIACHVARAPGVRVMGYAPSLSDAYRGMTVSVVPHLQSSGIINRVVDAMTAGVPLVASPETSSTVDGFIRGTHGLIASGAKKTARAVCQVLANDSLALELSSNAREFVRERFTWQEALASIENELLFLVASK